MFSVLKLWIALMYNKKLEKSVSVGMKVIMLFYNK